MSGVTRILGSVRWFVAWSVLVFPTLAWGQEATLVQQIGELSSEVAEAVAAEVTVVPLSPAIDARTTPIIVAPGEAFVHQGRPGQVGGLSGAERKAIRQAYAAGQTILLLHANVHDIEALHVLVEEGVTHHIGQRPCGSRLRASPGERHSHGQDRSQCGRDPTGASGHQSGLRGGRGGAATGPRCHHQRADPPPGAGCGAATDVPRGGPGRLAGQPGANKHLHRN